MIVMIDMDDTIEQMVAGFCTYLNRHYGTNVGPEAVTEWDMSKAFPTLTREQVYGAELTDELWDYVKPMPGADEALRKILADGHEIYIVTNTLHHSLRAKMEKVLFRYFPYIDWDHVIIIRNKQLLHGDVLIDDGPHNLIGGSYKKILFHAHHNASFDETSIGAVRAHGWEEAYAALCRLAGERNE